MDAKLLTIGGWKSASSKCQAQVKGKDTAFQKAISAFENLADNKYDEQIKAAPGIVKAANDLKKIVDAAKLTDVSKYLASVVAAANEALKQATADKAKAAKEDAEAKKRAAAEAKKEEEADEEEEEDESADTITKLISAIKSLKTSKKPYFFLLCAVKPFGIIISRKDITKSMTHKAELAKLTGGVTRPPKFGTCLFENGKLVLEMAEPPSGIVSPLQKWINTTTKQNVKIKIGEETGEDEGAGPAAAGADRPALDEAADIWHETRDTITKGIDQLKAAIRKEFAEEGPALLKEIENNIKKLDGVMDKLDHRLAESMKKAHSAKDNAARDAELKNAQKILKEYQTYLNNEPLISHIDDNPFGVKVGIKDLLTAKLGHMSQAVG